MLDINSRNIINKECIDILADKTIMLEFSENEERKKTLFFPWVFGMMDKKVKG